jgi:hypothetical protein
MNLSPATILTPDVAVVPLTPGFKCHRLRRVLSVDPTLLRPVVLYADERTTQLSQRYPHGLTHWYPK